MTRSSRDIQRHRSFLRHFSNARTRIRRLIGQQRIRRMIIEQLEHRHLLASVTVITHGFSATGSRPDWPVALGQAILDVEDGSDTAHAIGSLFIHNPTSGTWNAAPSTVWNNSNSTSEAIVLVYDWLRSPITFRMVGWSRQRVPLLSSGRCKHALDRTAGQQECSRPIARS